jgi:hypothetical protein
MKVIVRHAGVGTRAKSAREAFHLAFLAKGAVITFVGPMEYGGEWEFASIDSPDAQPPPADWRSVSWWWPVPEEYADRRGLQVTDVIRLPRYKSMLDAAEAALKASDGARADVLGTSPSGAVRVTFVPRFSECWEDKECPVTRGYTARWWVKMARGLPTSAGVPWGGSDTRL